MSQESAIHEGAETGSIWLRPWRVLLAGLGFVVVGAGLVTLDSPVVTPAGLLLILVGMIAGGWAVQRRLQSAGDDLDDRVESAGFVAVYSFAGLAGFLGMKDEWTSGKIFFSFFVVASIVGSLLVLLPRFWRVLTATVLIVLHFGAIVTASTSMTNTAGEIPWLPMQLLARVYRPYCFGMYLTNAYHFYAPEPGASTLLWFRIEYADGKGRWLKFPNRAASESPLHYQRQMAMAESTNASRGNFASPQEYLRLLERRLHAGRNFRVAPIPLYNDVMQNVQYSAPSEHSKILLESYARHVCRFYPHPDNPDIKAVKVKVYRLGYTILKPAEFLQNPNPYDDNLKQPFFMGEFDTDGNLLKPESVAEGDDPFLYWVVPMESLKYHAGDVKEEEVKEP